MKRKSTSTKCSAPVASSSSGRTTRARPSAPSRPFTIEALPLKPYQRRGTEWLLSHPYAALFLDPGLGKTLIVLLAFWLLKRRSYVDFLVVVAPLRPCYQVWPAEVTKWGFNFKVAVLHGKGKALIEQPHDIYVVNYDGLTWFHSQVRALRQRGNGMLVIDESHHVKHKDSLRSRTLHAILPAFGRRVLLTGTPASEGYLDLFGQLYCLDLGQRLGKFITHFRARFFHVLTPDGEPWDPIMRLPDGREFKRPRPTHFLYVPKKNAQQQIQRAIRDVCLRFSDRDLGLAPWTTVTREIELPPKVRRLYEQLEEQFILAARDVNDEQFLVDASNAGVLGTKLRQIANGGLLDGTGTARQLHYEKAEAVAELLGELNGQPLFVAYEFHHDRERLLKVLGAETPYIDGTVPTDLGLARMAEFNQGRHRALLVQSSMMEGLNLQEACHHVCWHSLTWKLTHYIQLIKRVHRLGQRHKVIVYHLVAKDTRDERVAEVLARKDRNQKQLCEALRQL